MRRCNDMSRINIEESRSTKYEYATSQNVIAEYEQPDHCWMYSFLYFSIIIGIRFTHYKHRSFSVHLYRKGMVHDVGFHT